MIFYIVFGIVTLLFVFLMFCILAVASNQAKAQNEKFLAEKKMLEAQEVWYREQTKFTQFQNRQNERNEWK